MANRRRRDNRKTTGQTALVRWLTRQWSTVIAAGLVVALVGGAYWLALSPSSHSTVEVTVPELSAMAATGKKAFDANCAQCHGVNGAGTDHGPPLVHDIYNPGHHTDAAFHHAVRRGVRQHHWPYGNMPPQPQVSDRQVGAIVRYVRELQEANGITYRPHRM